MLCPWGEQDRGAVGRMGWREGNGVDVFCLFSSMKPDSKNRWTACSVRAGVLLLAVCWARRFCCSHSCVNQKGNRGRGRFFKLLLLLIILWWWWCCGLKCPWTRYWSWVFRSGPGFCANSTKPFYPGVPGWVAVIIAGVWWVLSSKAQASLFLPAWWFSLSALIISSPFPLLLSQACQQAAQIKRSVLGRFWISEFDKCFHLRRQAASLCLV